MVDALIDIVLPGDENLTEATILEWHKSVGDRVSEHEPLLEVSTDKVTMEVPSPATGILTEALAAVDSVVYPGTILGRIDPRADGQGDPPVVAAEPLTSYVEEAIRGEALSDADASSAFHADAPTDTSENEPKHPSDTEKKATQPPVPNDNEDEDYNADAVVSNLDGARLSPLVKRMLREHNLSPTDVKGSGRDGRITHRDILAHLEGQDDILENVQEADPIAEDASEPHVAIDVGDSEKEWSSESEPKSDWDNESVPADGDELDVDEENNLWGFLDADDDKAEVSRTKDAISDNEEPGSDPPFRLTEESFAFESDATGRQPHSTMRRTIARHMVDSVRTAPHVTSVFDADLSSIISHRNRYKEEAERRGIKLTFTSYFVAAAATAIREVPRINSVWHDDGLELIRDINIGIATALEDDGLVVPVIHGADDLDLFGIARRLQDMIASARNSTLSRADVSGGTFTITNHGVSGSLIATPIINQPQSAILGIGRLEKRVVVRTVGGHDSMQIVPMAYVTLTIDHRVLDGNQANGFLSAFVRELEQWDTSDKQNIE